MLVLLSPAKKLDFSPDALPVRATQPRMLADTRELLTTTRKLSEADLRRLMGLSPALAELNRERFQAFAADPKQAAETRAAAFAFRGDTYVGLGADDFDADDLRFAQTHVRILSGLYGLLRPLDRIQPYRLEMGTRLKNSRGDNLYAFWGDRIQRTLASEGRKQGARAIINCASGEYFTAARADGAGLPVITPAFKELRGGKAKIISFSAKRARGMMARHIVKQRLTDPEDIKGFDEEGYRYRPELSDAQQWVFLRKQPNK